jgi:hypothetical protein
MLGKRNHEHPWIRADRFVQALSQGINLIPRAPTARRPLRGCRGDPLLGTSAARRPKGALHSCGSGPAAGRDVTAYKLFDLNL